jgi:hypothetical protein
LTVGGGSEFGQQQQRLSCDASAFSHDCAESDGSSKRDIINKDVVAANIFLLSPISRTPVWKTALHFHNLLKLIRQNPSSLFDISA